MIHDFPSLFVLQRRICAELGLSADEVAEIRIMPHCIEADVYDLNDTGHKHLDADGDVARTVHVYRPELIAPASPERNRSDD